MDPHMGQNPMPTLVITYNHCNHFFNVTELFHLDSILIHVVVYNTSFPDTPVSFPLTCGCTAYFP